MDQFDLNVEEKNIVNGLDRLLINVGLAFIALLPTHFWLIFRPKVFAPILGGETSEGKQLSKLGPGVTFVLTFLLLLGVSYFFRDVLQYRPTAEDGAGGASGIRSAISEGNIWRSVILALPFYLAALFLGVLLHFCHFALKMKSDLRRAVGAGFYLLSTILFFIVPLGVMEETQVSKDIQTTITSFLLIVLLFIIMPWQIYSVSKHAFKNRTGKAVLLAVMFCVLLLILFPLFALTMFTLSQGIEPSSQTLPS